MEYSESCSLSAWKFMQPCDEFNSEVIASFHLNKNSNDFLIKARSSEKISNQYKDFIEYSRVSAFSRRFLCSIVTVIHS
jgi:hypothetical protein